MVCSKQQLPHTRQALPAESKISKEEINAMPLFGYSGETHVVNTKAEERVALKRLQGATILGFDTETRPSFRKGKVYNPALIQVAIEEAVFLFHIKTLELSSELCAFFANPGILKVGVAIKDDMRALTRILPFEPAGIIDLALVARRNKIAQQGLRGLAAYFLGVRISKGEQCSNWGKDALSPKQIAYAATDAWISLAIYNRMQEYGIQ